MDKKNILKYILLFVCCIFIGLYFSGFFDSKDNTNEYQKDFFKEINKEYKKDDKDVSSRFIDAQVEVDTKVKEFSKELINNNPKMKILYNQFMDFDTRNKVGLDVLEQYINKLNNSKNIKEFVNNAMEIEYDLDVDVFTNITIMSDMKDTSKNIVYFEPITMDFGAECYYYNNKDYDMYASYFKKYGLMMLEAYNKSTTSPREISTKVFELEKNICKDSYSQDDRTNSTNFYHKVTKEELKNIYSNIDIDKYLKLYGIDNQNYYSVVDKGNFTKFNSLLTDDNLEVLKHFITLKILEQYGAFTNTKYLDIYKEFYNLINTNRELNTYEEIGYKTVEIAYSNTFGKYYVDKEFSEKKQEIINNIITDVLSFYEEDINNISWMKKETKEKALSKIKNMKVYIGYNPNMPTYENSYNINANNSLIKNVMSINDTKRKYLLDQLNKSGFYLDIPLTMVNAFYNVLDNSINFPGAIGVMFNEDDDYYSILGSMGMIIGHEITHSLSSLGAQFDENGNLVEWWTKEDKEEYEKLQQKVIDYYSKFEIAKGVKVDGKKTLDENIADLGGLHAITEIARKKNAKDDDYKKMYESYAKMWADNYSNEYLIGISVMDVHSPNRIRVNAALVTLDKFRELYDINENTPMYQEESDVTIW